MKTKFALTQSDVLQIAAAAQAHAEKNNWIVSIAIVDDGGHLMHFTRLDGAPATTVEISQAKARMSSYTTRETRFVEEVVNKGRTSYLSVLGVGAIRGAALEGGVPITVEGQCVGAVGVSGVKSIEDAEIAMAGIAAVVKAA